MIEMKYVVVLSKEQGKQLFTFPKNVEHKAFADILSYLRVGPDRSWTRPFREPISAGFTDGVKCYGRSESLGLKSHPDDTALLAAGGVA